MTLTPPPSPDPYDFAIGEYNYTWSIPAWTYDHCFFTETLSFAPDLNTIPWISVSGRTVTISTSDTLLHETTQNFIVTTTVDDSSNTSNN